MNITFKPHLRETIVNRDHPINASGGGQVPFYSGETEKQKHSDTLRANLESGELVIPLRHVKKVEEWLAGKELYDIKKGKFIK